MADFHRNLQFPDFKGNIDPVPDAALPALVRWPYGTRGYHEELVALRTLNKLCIQHGYGGLPSLAKRLETMWRDGPEGVHAAAAESADWLDMVETARPELAAAQGAEPK